MFKTYAELARAKEWIVCDPAASYWIKQTFRDLNKRDPVDVLHDLELLLKIFKTELRVENELNEVPSAHKAIKR